MGTLVDDRDEPQHTYWVRPEPHVGNVSDAKGLQQTLKKFNGEVETLGQNFLPLTNFWGRSNIPSARGHRPSLTSETQSPSPYGWPGRGNYLYFFSNFRSGLLLKNFGRFTSCQNFTVRILNARTDEGPYSGGVAT